LRIFLSDVNKFDLGVDLYTRCSLLEYFEIKFFCLFFFLNYCNWLSVKTNCWLFWRKFFLAFTFKVLDACVSLLLERSEDVSEMVLREVLKVLDSRVFSEESDIDYLRAKLVFSKFFLLLLKFLLFKKFFFTFSKFFFITENFRYLLFCTQFENALHQNADI